ncbi:hypothetical protein FRB96_005845 [Tulasnella sp. 330]|nr:hypothetical protein FRB96_005845 [Tulasnella sp. 330]KAG8870840.1 hypothetical protein FRB97_009329 [Tulasnella sp. 331]KAG8873687.1 hypothetical protein FRB98_008846 [Tulasnella sp. 332]
MNVDPATIPLPTSPTDAVNTDNQNQTAQPRPPQSECFDGSLILLTPEPLVLQDPSLIKGEESANPIGEGKLLEDELPWCSRFDFLRDHGYLLRPRYHPGWKASWLDSKVSAQEDRIVLKSPHVADATRISDGATIFLKHVQSSSPEIEIGRFLCSETLRNDPRNHSIPLLDVLEDPSEPDHAILVLPLLRRLDMPKLASVRECVALVEQSLEGLAFLHEHKVAHRDCAWGNIMMDGRAMFPGGWHPQQDLRTPDGQRLQNQNSSRTAAGGVRYYIIDFGISTHGKDQSIGFNGQERAPELSNRVPYNPYKLDVYILGMMYQHFLVEQCNCPDFIKPLIDYMTPASPEDRPTIAEALERFKSMRRNMSNFQLSQRLRPSERESGPTRVFRDAYYRLCDSWWTLKPKKTLPPLA